jgi:hypothetical protein
MYPPPERRWPGLVAAYLVLVVVLAVPAAPIYYYVEPAYKLLVIRVCAGIVLAFTLHRLVGAVREQLEQQPLSSFDAAARLPAGAVYLAPQFERLRDEVGNSMRSRAYFTHILRLRLLTLLDRKARARFGMRVTDLLEQPLEGIDPKLLTVLTHEPPRRILPRWGIRLHELRALVQTLEEL